MVTLKLTGIDNYGEKKDTLIPIRVVLNFYVDVEAKFEKQFELLFGGTLTYQKTWQNDYDLKVTVEQLELYCPNRFTHILMKIDEQGGF